MADILVLDDISDAGVLVKRILERKSHQVTAFTEEEEALTADLMRLSVGPQVLHADHTITIYLNEADRRLA